MDPVAVARKPIARPTEPRFPFVPEVISTREIAGGVSWAPCPSRQTAIAPMMTISTITTAAILPHGLPLGVSEGRPEGSSVDIGSSLDSAIPVSSPLLELGVQRRQVR